MICYIEFEDSPIGIVSPSKVLKVSFICSIYKVYSMANLMLSGLAKQYFNDIKCGSPINFVFKDDNNTYINKMRVLSFSKIPDSQYGMSDILNVTLISAIYFDKSAGTMVHEGSVGSIYDTIMSKFFNNSVVEYSGTLTDDLPRRRYQTQERTLDFMKRILKYGIQGGMPVYLFHDAKGVLNLKGISEMSKSLPSYTAVPSINGVSPEMGLSSTNSFLTIWDFISEFDGKTTCGFINNVFTTANFRFNNKIVDSYTFKGVDTQNNQILESIPPKTKFYGWNLAPNDAMAIAAKESFEKLTNSCMFRGIFQDFDVSRLNLGSTISVQLPEFGYTARNSNGEASNLGEGRYLITDLEFLAEGNKVQTTATMMQVAC